VNCQKISWIQKEYIHGKNWIYYLFWKFIQLSICWQFFTQSLPKIRHTVCQLSGVSTRFQVNCPGLHVAHWNTRGNSVNFVVNCHKTHINTLKSSFKCACTALFWPWYLKKINQAPSVRIIVKCRWLCQTATIKRNNVAVFESLFKLTWDALQWYLNTLPYQW